MPFQFHENVNPNDLHNVRYGFFTNEMGNSDSEGYLMLGNSTRNVNLYSPNQDSPNQDITKIGYDLPSNVAENIDACFQELLAGFGDCQSHKIFMTTNYAKGGLRIISCANTDELEQLKQEYQNHVGDLGLHRSMIEQLAQKNVQVLKS